MRKQLRNIIISLCVVVLLVAGIISVNIFSKSGGTSSSSSQTSSTQTITVYKTDSKKITTLHIKNNAEEVMLHQSNGKYTVDGLADKLVNQDTASSTFTAAADVTAEKLIEKNSSNLSQYGLDNPKLTVDVVSGNTTVTLEIGNATPTDDGNYLCMKGSKDVYKILTATTNSFKLKKTDLVNLSICGFESSNAAKLTEITLGGTERSQPIVLDVDPTSTSSTSSTSSGSSSVTYLMKSPRTYQLNNDNVSKISSALQSLSASGVLSLDMSDATLSKYGLKNPKYNLSAVYNGNKMVLDFGEPFDDDGTTMLPVVLEGTPVIYKVSESTLSFYNWQLSDITNTMLYSEYIDNVASITVTTGSENYTINFSGKGDQLTGTYGSKKLNTDNLRKFYQNLLGISFEGAASKPANTSVYAKVVITYHNSSRKPTTMEFITIDTRRYFWTIDGQGDFYVLKSSVDKMLDATRKLIAGKTVSEY